MEDKSLNTKIGNATKWSTITELMAKFISPLSSMVLARLLSPEAFGVVATINLVISFADMYTDAGFQKYLIQHEFQSEEQRYQNANVAFWSNLSVSLLLWLVISVFRDSLAAMVGSPGLGNVLVIACISLPITSFSSIQRGLYQRSLDFKTLFWVRIIGTAIPIFVTIPLAIVTKSYWALIVGTIVKNLSDAFVMTIRSKWKPKFYYSFQILKEMFSFSCWTLIEQTTIWLCTYVGTFIVGRFLSSYYIGLYKTSMTTVNQFTTLITTSISPVLFSSLARLQFDEDEFKKLFLKFQRLIGTVSIPLCIGMFVYKELVVKVLLGNQWVETTFFIGIWSLSGALVIVGQSCSEVYRAKGLPRLSTLVQVLLLAISIPVIYYGALQGYYALCITQTISRLSLVIIHLVVMSIVIKFSAVELIMNLMPCFISSLIMTIVALILKGYSDNIIWKFVSILICIVVYFSILALFKVYREEIIKPWIEKYRKKLAKI